MTYFTRRAVLLIAGITVLLSWNLLYAQEKVHLKANVPAGTSWTFSQTEQMDMDTTMSASGQQQQLQQRASRKISGTADVLESRDGIPTSMRFTFDRDSGGQVEMMGQTQPLPFPLAGQTVTTTLKDGQFSHDFKGPLEPQIEQELRSLAELDEKFLPTEAVGVGDTWSPDRDALARSWQIDVNKNKFDVGMKLTDFKEVDGRRVAVVEMTADVMGEFPDMPGVSGQRKIKGTALVDMQTARVLSAEAGGTIQGSGNTQMQGMDVQINTRGTISSKSATKLKAPNGTSPAGPLGGPPEPVQPGGTGAAPPPAEAAGSFAGTYSDQQITVELSEQGEQYTGTITMGDQKFPLKGRVQAGQLVGTFQSQGADFDFTATLQGGGLKFSTGGTDYSLTKARKNPLTR